MDEFFAVKEVAAMFKLKPNTIYAHVAGWPHTRITPTDNRFSREDIEAIKEMSRRTPAPVMRERSTRIGTGRQKARNRAYNLRNDLKERPVPR